MSFADNLAAAAAQRGPVCSVGIARDKLNDADRKAFLAAMADRSVSGSTIAAALRAEGHEISDPTLNRHRGGRCLCKS